MPLSSHVKCRVSDLVLKFQASLALHVHMDMKEYGVHMYFLIFYHSCAFTKLESDPPHDDTIKDKAKKILHHQ